MTTINDAYQAGIDAVLADNTLNRGGFADAIRTVVVQALSDAEAKDWIDALAVEYNRVGQINNGTYGSLRLSIVADGNVLALARFDALGLVVNQMIETTHITVAIELIDLRIERDEADANIDILQGLRTGQPRQVREAIKIGIEQLRGFKQQTRDRIQAITGDPEF